MYSANAFVIRLAGDNDEYDLYRLAELDEKEPLEHPVLIGEIDGEPAAALSLEDRRAVADPFRRTDLLLSHLRLRAAAFDAAARRPAVADRIRHALAPRYAS
jgi:hypothetical protein